MCIHIFNGNGYMCKPFEPLLPTQAQPFKVERLTIPFQVLFWIGKQVFYNKSESFNATSMIQRSNSIS